MLPLFSAALRELFEEAGVLLAAHDEGSPAGGAAVATLARQRDLMLAEAAGFYAELSRLRLTLSIERLLPWSRWITPPGAQRRFDTIFFVAQVDRNTALQPHEGEIADAAWLPLHTTATQALRRERTLMSPTLLTLLQLSESLQRGGGLADLFAGTATGLMTPVQPKTRLLDDQSWIVLPWDADDGERASHGWRDYRAKSCVPGRIRSAI